MKEIAVIISFLVLYVIMCIEMGTEDATKVILSLSAIGVIMAYVVYCVSEALILAVAL